MLDVNYLENFTEEAIERLNSRGSNYRSLVEKIVSLSRVRKLNLARVEQYRAQKNQFTKSIRYLIQTDKNKEQLKIEIETIKQEINKLDTEIKIISQELERINQELKGKGGYLPNLPDFETPIGKNESDNVEVFQHYSQLIPAHKVSSH